ANIRVCVADYSRGVRRDSRASCSENSQASRECRLGRTGPIYVNAAFGLVEKIFDVGASLAVDGDAAAARDVADNVVAGNGVAALRAIDHQVVVAADNDGSVAQAEHAFDCRDQLRALIFGRLLQRLSAGF